MTTGLVEEDSVPAIYRFIKNDPHIEVYEQVRRGNNGEVYFGKRKKLGDEVVLKFYIAQENYDSTEEAVILKSIQHPNILKIYDLRFVYPHYAYFLTPRISGGDLQGIIDSEKLSTRDALNILAGILKGLTELHATHQLVHRDLKPGNILISLPDKNPIIADLGAIKKVDSIAGFTSASKSTFLYLPPEAIQYDVYNFQSDIYQVGIMMFQLLGGHFPINDPEQFLTEGEAKQLHKIRNSWDRKQKYEALISNKIIKGKIADCNSLPQYLDPLFKRVLNKALNYHHEKRFANTSMFLREIHQLQRTCPDYKEDADKLLIIHDNGKSFIIYKNKKGEVILEKNIQNKGWRKDNSHNGSMASALNIARTN